jgi:tRNA (guanine37-N1)-methyltransferase
VNTRNASIRADKPSIRFDIFTLFPEMFGGPFDASILQKAATAGIIEIQVHQIRDWAHDRHRTVDDRPYGGGAGMVMMAPPVVEAVESVLGNDLPGARKLVMSPAGIRFDQRLARSLAQEPRIAVICGHYEGIDERVADVLDAEEVSIGDFVLTGGEIPAMAIVDAVSRLVPGVIKAHSIEEESHDEGLVEYPHYTRPAEFRGLSVPEVLLSGHHQQVADWRRAAAAAKQAKRDEREAEILEPRAIRDDPPAPF